MTLLRRREPAGTPTGSQFATEARTEAGVTLSDATPDGLDHLRSHLAAAGISGAMHRADGPDGGTHATLTTAAGEDYTVAYNAFGVYVTHPASGNALRMTRAAWQDGFTAADVPRALASVRQRVAALRTWETVAGTTRGTDVTYSHVEVDDDPTFGRTATVWAEVNGTSYELRATTTGPNGPAEVTAHDGGSQLPANKGLDVLEVVGRAHGNHVSPGWYAADLLRSVHRTVTDHPEWA